MTKESSRSELAHQLEGVALTAAPGGVLVGLSVALDTADSPIAPVVLALGAASLLGSGLAAVVVVIGHWAKRHYHFR